MINGPLKLLEAWRWDKFDVHSRYVYEISQCQCLFARRGLDVVGVREASCLWEGSVDRDEE